MKYPYVEGIFFSLVTEINIQYWI